MIDYDNSVERLRTLPASAALHTGAGWIARSAERDDPAYPRSERHSNAVFNTIGKTITAFGATLLALLVIVNVARAVIASSP